MGALLVDSACCPAHQKDGGPGGRVRGFLLVENLYLFFIFIERETI